MKPISDEIISEYVGWACDESDILSSASGAIAISMYRKVVLSGGYAVGVVWSNTMDGRAEYKITNKIENIDLFRTSKYVQAEKKDIINQIENVAVKGKKILIIALPCEIAAFKRTLSKYSNILYCDMICVGPMSTFIFRDYLNDVCKRYKSAIKDINMRYKIGHKERPHLRLLLKNGYEFIKPFYETDVGLAFTVFGRKNCSKCNYLYVNSVADITIGDYVEDKCFNEIGVSRIIVHTSEGNSFVNSLNQIHKEVTNGKSDILFNKRKMRNKELRDLFASDFCKRGYKYAVIKKFGVLRRWLNAIKDRKKG
jgi:coenzyme F420-reducing hydrogenase beta subunit